MNAKFSPNKLKKILRDKNIEYSVLSYLLGEYGEHTAVATIKKWFVKNDSIKPSFKKIKALANVLGVTPNDLYTERIFATPQNLNDEMCLIPKLGVLAGAGSEGVFDIAILETSRNIPVDKEIIGKLDPKNLRAIEIVGDSMEPEYFENDVAIIDLVNGRYNFIKISGIYIVRVDEIVYIKRVEFIPNGCVKLISLNPKYSDILLNSDDNFEILGKVCGKIHFSKGLVFSNQGIS